MIVKNTREKMLNERVGKKMTQKQAHTQTTNSGSGREGLYSQYFSPRVSDATPPTGFIPQVNGYGVQVFSQASCFKPS